MTRADELAVDHELAARLRVTWAPFFGRFGRLRPVQREAMPLILEGADALVIAPTASGKTEAACAPLIERFVGMADWTILYVSPTRALVNDLYERLYPRVAQLGLSIKRRTGDHRDPLKNASNLVLTTPESFDSLLCRGRQGPGDHALGAVVAVVLDEIHLVAGGARGEQLRWLLGRQRRLRAQVRASQGRKPDRVQVVALSATVRDGDALARTFLGPNAAVVSVAGSRDIEVVTVDAELPDAMSTVPAYLAQTERPEKVLVFSNARRRVDTLARDLVPVLKPLGYPVSAHHGSLAQEERETTERTLKDEDQIVVCATMTLEIGIDIGDVDLVVLDSPAPSVSSLLQRIGRGNRRTAKTRVLLCSGSPVEALVHAAMLEAARRGDLGVAEEGPHFAVTIQQLASYIFQAPTRHRPRQQLLALLAEYQPLLDAAELIDHLVATGQLAEDQAGVRLGPDWQDKIDKGSIHSTIEDRGGYQVVDTKGTKIGKGIRSQTGRGIGIAGKLLEVKSWERFQIVVGSATRDVASAGQWSYVSGDWMQGAGQPRAVQSYLGFGIDAWPLLRVGGELCVFHFGGARRKAVIKLIERLSGTKEIRHLDEWTLWLPDAGGASAFPPSWIRDWSPSVLELLLAGDELYRLERALARPQANKGLPIDVRVREVAAWLQLEAESAAFQSASWEPVEDAPTRDALRLVAASLRPQHIA